MSEIEGFLNAYGLAAIFVVLLIKSIGVPIPVPSDVIMLAAAATQIKRGGALSIGVAIFTPGVRAAAVATCGATGVSRHVFLAALLLGSSVFLGAHVAIGYAGGALLARLNPNLLSVPVIVALVILLLMLGLVGWIEIRRRRRPHAPYSEIIAEAVEAWHEATCPVCLAMGSATARR